MKTKLVSVLPLTLAVAFSLQPSVLAFEGRIGATVTQGGQGSGLLYTVGTNQLRIEQTDTNWPHARNLVDRQTGALTLLFPHNRSFVRLKPVTPVIGPTNLPGPPAPPPTPPMPNLPAPPAGLPPGVGPQSGVTPGVGAASAIGARMPPGIGPQPGAAPGMGAGPGIALGMTAMPPISMMPGMMEKAELKATGQKTNLLGYACERFELKQRGETLEVWATDQLFPFQAYQQNQPHRFGPRIMEEQWPELLKARRLFPLLVTLRFESGPERYRFEVNSIQPGKVADPNGRLFQPPPDYHEIEPLPF